MTRLKLHPIEELYLHLADEGYTPVREYRFAPPRKWAFDLALGEQMVAVEYEGGIWQQEKSGHTTGKGYADNCRKYNMATLMGWRVLRFTAGDFGDDGYALKTILRALDQSRRNNKGETDGNA